MVHWIFPFPNFIGKEKAINFLISNWQKEEKPPKRIVKAPIIRIKNKLKWEISKKKLELNLINKKTPAVTIVAACNKAETGVGPAMASPNQQCKKIWADLAIAARIKKNKNKLIIK